MHKVVPLEEFAKSSKHSCPQKSTLLPAEAYSEEVRPGAEISYGQPPAKEQFRFSVFELTIKGT